MIRTEGLTKAYGPTIALADVDLVVPEGSVYGLVGPNGAGKTTLLAILAGLRRPTAGEVVVEVDRSAVAVLADTPRFDPWLTGREVVALARRLVADDGDRVDEVLVEAGLADAADRSVEGYSRGMLQRLGVAATIVGDPRLVLLDEPASALDPLGRREVLDLVARLRGSATVLFSSHILADVQAVCDRVGVLDAGRLRFQGPLESLLVGSAVPRYLIRCRPPLAPIVSHLRSQAWVTDIEVLDEAEMAVAVTGVEAAEAGLAPALADAGARVVSVRPEAVSLERAFLELTT